MSKLIYVNEYIMNIYVQGSDDTRLASCIQREFSHLQAKRRRPLCVQT